MPHDLNGTPLKEGDHVVIEGVITALQTGAEYCNVTIETDEPMYPGETKSSIVLNTRQVTLCRHAETE